mmetsp:Transcript_10586/g.15421  ORF Transcript_10586/g.15421 Transcript_10586/m.15421 type:complete len:119 (-) Transcript_10586:263-619(-)
MHTSTLQKQTDLTHHAIDCYPMYFKTAQLYPSGQVNHTISGLLVVTIDSYWIAIDYGMLWQADMEESSSLYTSTSFMDLNQTIFPPNSNYSISSMGIVCFPQCNRGRIRTSNQEHAFV